MAYRDLVEGLATKCVVHFVLPASFYPCGDKFLWNVLDLSGSVVARVILEDDALNLILCPPKPALLQIFENDFQSGLGACDVTSVGHRDAEGAYYS